MKEADLKAVERTLEALGASWKPAKVAVIAPTREEVDLLQRCFPGTQVFSWYLHTLTFTSDTVDLLVACNVLSCVDGPERWIDLFTERASLVLIQDGIRAWRGATRELGNDGDKHRFTFPLRDATSRIDGIDLESIVTPRQPIEFYKDDPGYRKHDGREMDALKFVALIDGKKATLVDAPDVRSDHDDTQGVDISEPIIEEASKARRSRRARD